MKLGKVALGAPRCACRGRAYLRNVSLRGARWNGGEQPLSGEVHGRDQRERTKRSQDPAVRLQRRRPVQLWSEPALAVVWRHDSINVEHEQVPGPRL